MLTIDHLWVRVVEALGAYQKTMRTIPGANIVQFLTPLFSSIFLINFILYIYGFSKIMNNHPCPIRFSNKSFIIYPWVQEAYE